jgi:thiol:disulfide interchange protein DsbD
MTFRYAVRFLLAAILLAFAPMARGQLSHSSADVSAEINPLTVHAGDSGTVAVVVNVHPGLHAQSHTPVDDYAIKFEVTPGKSDAVDWGEVKYPAGLEKTFPNLGKLNVYEGKTVIELPLKIKPGMKPGPLTLAGTVHFQACNEETCFPPEDVKFSVQTTVVPAASTTAANNDFPQVTAAASSTPVSDSALAEFAGAFLIGIIFNLMPCVLPVLPLKIMGFYEASKHDRRKSILLGAVFSAGLIASFAVLACLVVGSTKLQWGGLFQHTWFTITISSVLVVMAIGTFGFFSVNVPTALYSFTPRHDTYVGNFLFGILTAALSTPCTFGVFAALLAWALQQPPIVGGSAIVMVGVGMAFPYFVLSAFPEVARNFPRTGPWAGVVKQMMGFFLLATALYFAKALFPRVSSDMFWWLLFGVIAAGGLFLVIRGIQLSDRFLPRAIAAGVALLLVLPSLGVVYRITERPFDWVPYSDQALATATASGKPVLIDFTADWCGNCHYIEAKVLHNSRVVKSIKGHQVVMMQADMTNKNAPAEPLLIRLTAAGEIPLTAIFLPHQSKPELLKGIYSADDLVNTLARVTP